MEDWVGLSGLTFSFFVASARQSVHHHRHGEPDGSLEPEKAPFRAHVFQTSTHVVKRNETADAGGGGEDKTQRLPPFGHGARRPGNAGDEQQGNGGENDERDANLTLLHQPAETSSKEDASQQIGEEEKCEVVGTLQTGKAEQARHDAEHIDRNGDIEQQPRQAAHDFLSRSIGNREIFFAGGAAAHPHAQKEGLLDDEHQHGGDEERGEAGLRVEDGHLFIVHGVHGKFLLS